MIRCPSCNGRLRLTDYVRSSETKCRLCDEKLSLLYFPALFEAIDKGQDAELVLSDDEASCFKHAEKKANSICSSCGVYICSLCELNIRDKTFCPSCFNNKGTTKDINPFNKTITIHSMVALSTVILGTITFLGSLATGPYILYYGFKNFKKEESLVRGRSPITFSIAIGIAGLQTIAWIALAVDFALGAF